MSKAETQYDEAVIKKFKEFVGVKEFKKLNKSFKPEHFAGKWKQVMSSPSTSVLGSGPYYSSVQATYTLKKKGLVGVKNEAYDNDIRKTSITGESRARDVNVPICRTVKFNNLFKIEGDYWIVYATPSFKTIIVSAPVILKLFNKPLVVTGNFGHYVLTRSRRQFWKDADEYQPTLDALKRYGFTKLWNKPVASAETFIPE